MSPLVSMNQTGLPVLTYMAIANKYRSKNLDIIIAGGLVDGGDIVKALALGMNAVGMARAFIIADEVGRKKLNDAVRGSKFHRRHNHRSKNARLAARKI